MLTIFVFDFELCFTEDRGSARHLFLDFKVDISFFIFSVHGLTLGSLWGLFFEICWILFGPRHPEEVPGPTQGRKRLTSRPFPR